MSQILQNIQPFANIFQQKFLTHNSFHAQTAKRQWTISRGKVAKSQGTRDLSKETPSK